MELRRIDVRKEWVTIILYSDSLLKIEPRSLISFGRLDQAKRFPRVHHVLQARDSGPPSFSTQALALLHS